MRIRNKLGRFIAIPIEVRPNLKTGYLFGLIIGDGSITKYKRDCRINMETTSIKYINHWKQAVLNAFPKLNPKIYTRIVTKKFPNGTVKTDIRMYIITFTSKNLYYVLRPFKQADYHWTVPSLLNTIEGKIGFLQGIFDAEGSIGSYGNIQLASKHKENLIQVKELLNKFGISSKIYNYDSRASSLHICKKRDKKKFSETIGFKYLKQYIKLQKWMPYFSEWGYSKASKKRWADPIFKKRLIEIHKRRWANPVIRKKMVNGMKNYYIRRKSHDKDSCFRK